MWLAGVWAFIAVSSRRLCLGPLAAVAGMAAHFAVGHRFGFQAGRDSLPVLRPYPSLGALTDWQGRVDICVQTSTRDEAGNATAGEVVETIEGTVVGSGDVSSVTPLAGNAIPCERQPDWYIDVADAQKVLWRILYAVSGIVIGRPNVRTGTRVTVRLRAHWDFGKAAGFMVSDQAGPILAAEQGAFGHGLEPEDLEPLTIRVSDVIGVRHEDCGDAVIHAVDVRGESATRVLSGRIGTLSFRGANYRFWNSASYSWINVQCMDMLDRMSWFLWRQ
jgi:hypothetical protein